VSEEQVLVLARSALSEARFEPRGQMEHDPSWKQIIPYLVLRDGRDYYLMRRTRAGADRRLHDRYSIGVGGHINPGDGGLLGGLRREWQEELEADFEPEFRLVGLLNDDATDVGSVHLGVVFLANLELGFLFPPMGLNLFLSASRFQKPLPLLYRKALPFLVIMAVGVLLITYVPAITTGVVALLTPPR